MKRFEYRLEPLRRYREQQKQHIEGKFAQVSGQLTLLQRQLEQLAQRIRQVGAMNETAADHGQLNRRLAESSYTERLREQIAQKQTWADQLRGEREKLRRQLEQISVALEQLEQLRATQYAEHQAEQSQKRQRELHEHITHKWFKGSSEEMQ